MFKKKIGDFDKGGTRLIKTQTHEERLQSVQELSGKTQTPKPLIKVTEQGKFFGLGTHKVTGKEFNTALSQIDDELIRSKEFDAAVLDHITALYKAMDALDAEHISGILTTTNVVKAVDDKVNMTEQNMEKVITLLKNNSPYLTQNNDLNEKVKAMEKNVKIANYIAGGSISLTIITLLLSIFNVI